MTYALSGRRLAWSQRGRDHALKGWPRQPPEDLKDKRAYLDGYRIAAREKARRDAEA